MSKEVKCALKKEGRFLLIAAAYLSVFLLFSEVFL
jgi:hypothetical protein